MPALDCKVYVGDLGSSANKHDLEDAFSHYGRLTNVWVARNPPGFAFVEFEDNRDAEDAVRALDGRSICGRRVRVELSTHGSRGGGGGGRYGGPRGGGGGGFGGRGAHPDDKCYQCGERGHFARDCRGAGGGRRKPRSFSRSRSRSPRRRRSYSRSVSRDRRSYRSRSRSPRRTKSRSPAARRSRSHSRQDSRSPPPRRSVSASVPAAEKPIPPRSGSRSPPPPPRRSVSPPATARRSRTRSPQESRLPRRRTRSPEANGRSKSPADNGT